MNRKPKRSTFRSRYEDMMITLREEMISGVWKAGSYLPSESDLAERFQLSKNSVRKGLDVLVDEGYLEKMPRIGNRVLMPPAGTTINFGYYPSMIQEVYLNELIGEFHHRHPLIRVNMVPMPYDHTSPNMKDDMVTKDIDVLAINNQNFELFVRPDGPPDLLEPLKLHDGIYPLLAEPFMSGGQLYVQPLVFSPIVLCYNKEHFAECGVPEPDSSWTWDTLKKAADRLSNGTDRYGFFFHLLSDNRWPIFLLQNRVTFLRKNGSLETDESVLEQSLQVLSGLLEQVFPPFISENDHDAEMLFRQQKVSMIMTSYYFLNLIKDVDFAYDISPLPYLATPKTLLIVIGLAINKLSKHKQAARAFIDFMMSYETQLKIRQHTMSIPSLKTAAERSEPGASDRPSRYYIYRETFPTFSYHTALNVTFDDLGDIRQRMKLYLSKLGGIEVFS